MSPLQAGPGPGLGPRHWVAAGVFQPGLQPEIGHAGPPPWVPSGNMGYLWRPGERLVQKAGLFGGTQGSWSLSHEGPSCPLITFSSKPGCSSSLLAPLIMELFFVVVLCLNHT